MKLIPAILLLAFAGCAIVESDDHVWYKEGATTREREAALAAAEVQARQSGQDTPAQRGMVVTNMTSQGYRLVPKASAPPPEPESAHPLPKSPRP